jgi:hypothetical protein
MVEAVKTFGARHDQIRNRLHAVTEPLDISRGAVSTEWSALEVADSGVIGLIPCQDDLVVTTIGRSESSTIRLDDQFVHREHARIRWDSMLEAHVVEDCGGLNGSFLDGRRLLYPRRLQDGATIRVGYTELIYRRKWSPATLSEARNMIYNPATPGVATTLLAHDGAAAD